MADTLAPLQEFLFDTKCLIVEPSQSFSSNIQIALQQMGLEIKQTFVARKYNDAKKFIEEQKPRIIVTEYEVDAKLGIDLLEIQNGQYEQSKKISFVTTKDSSDSSVAEAAEGHVDGYLLKPFPMESFQKKLEEILHQKMHPSEYSLKLNSGRAYFANQDFETACQEFLKAKLLNPKPTMACYYAGQSFQSKGDLEQSLREYQEGRKYQPLHYKCLVGEFDVLMAMKNYQVSYGLIEPLRKNYPITAKRLTQMFVAAVFANHFEDLPIFYDLFARIEQRTAELITISSLAFLTAGKFFIKQKNLTRAVEYFELGLLITARNLQFIEKAIAEFVKVKAGREAEILLAKVDPSDLGTPAYHMLEFIVDQLSLPKEQMIEKGRKLIFQGSSNPEIYRTVVQGMAELGKETLAEAVISKASESDPTMRATLYKVLADHLKKES